MDYNRLVKDLNGMSKDEFFTKLKAHYSIKEAEGQYKPNKKGEIGMYIDKKWYVLNTNQDLLNNPDPVEVL